MAVLIGKPMKSQWHIRWPFSSDTLKGGLWHEVVRIFHRDGSDGPDSDIADIKKKKKPVLLVDVTTPAFRSPFFHAPVESVSE